MDERLKVLRGEIEAINGQILDLLSRRGGLAKQVGALKDSLGIGYFDPQREREMLLRIVGANKGPFNDAAVMHLFQQIFRASTDLMETTGSRKPHAQDATNDPEATINIAGNPLVDSRVDLDDRSPRPSTDPDRCD